MSIAKLLTIVGICVLLAGCAPITGVKGILALVISLMAAAGAAWGVTRDMSETRVCQKATELDETVTAHETKYHGSPSIDSVITMKSKSNGAAAPDTESKLSQRM